MYCALSDIVLKGIITETLAQHGKCLGKNRGLRHSTLLCVLSFRDNESEVIQSKEWRFVKAKHSTVVCNTHREPYTALTGQSQATSVFCSSVKILR